MARQKWTGAIVLVILAVLPGSDFGSLTADEAPRRQRSTVPAPDDVAVIQYVIGMSGEQDLKCELTVKDAFTLRSTVALLNKVDWKQKGTNLENVRIKKPEIEMTLIEKKGKKHRYAFYWEGNSLIDWTSNRMLETSCSGFRHFVIRALVIHCGKDRIENRKPE